MTTIPTPLDALLAAASRGAAAHLARIGYGTSAARFNEEADLCRAEAYAQTRKTAESTPLQTFHLGASIVEEVVAFPAPGLVEWVDQHGTTHLTLTSSVTLAGITQ